MFDAGVVRWVFGTRPRARSKRSSSPSLPFRALNSIDLGPTPRLFRPCTLAFSGSHEQSDSSPLEPFPVAPTHARGPHTPHPQSHSSCLDPPPPIAPARHRQV